MHYYYRSLDDEHVSDIFTYCIYDLLRVAGDSFSQ